MIAVTNVAFAVLGLSAALCLARLLRPSSLPDRVIALDLFALVLVIGVAVGIARTGERFFADLMVAAALLAFVATVVTARFIEDRGT